MYTAFLSRFTTPYAVEDKDDWRILLVAVSSNCGLSQNKSSQPLQAFP